ncbi:MAG TPA: hypothetical protein ENH94_09970 [Phycisphaerales bacterium]|nr:hypothetical protein [Phycisphaerales bacterium]
MKVYRVILVVAMLVFAGNAMGMGKSDGTKEEVKSSLSKESAAPAKVETKACPTTCTKPCCAKDAKVDAKKSHGHSHSTESKDAKACPTTADKTHVCSTDEKKACCPADAKAAAKPEVKAVKAEVKPAVDALFVTVNGVKITQSKIDEKIKPQVDAQLKRMADMGRPATEEMINGMKTQMTQRVLDIMIIEQLMGEKQKTHKIKVSKEEVQAEIEVIAKGRDIPMDKLENELSKYGMTMASLAEQVEMGLSFDKVINVEAKAAGKDVTVSDEDAKKFYDENATQFSSPEQVKASHILAGGRGVKDEDRSKLKVKIEEVAQKLKAGGNFEDLAREHSDCPSSADGGDLKSFFDNTGRIIGGRGGMDAKFTEAAFALKVGQVSGIVETPFGYHIIKLSEKIAAVTKTFDEVKDTIKTNLEQKSRGTFSRDFIEKLKTDATIVWAEGKEPTPRSAMPRSDARTRRPPSAARPSVTKASVTKANAAKASAAGAGDEKAVSK